MSGPMRISSVQLKKAPPSTRTFVSGAAPRLAGSLPGAASPSAASPSSRDGAGVVERFGERRRRRRRRRLAHLLEESKDEGGRVKLKTTWICWSFVVEATKDPISIVILSGATMWAYAHVTIPGSGPPINDFVVARPAHGRFGGG